MADGWLHCLGKRGGDIITEALYDQFDLTHELGSEAVLAAVAKSKFRNVAGSGTRIKGHILLQDHTGQVWFRSLKLRDLSGTWGKPGSQPATLRLAGAQPAVRFVRGDQTVGPELFPPAAYLVGSAFGSSMETI